MRTVTCLALWLLLPVGAQAQDRNVDDDFIQAILFGGMGESSSVAMTRVSAQGGGEAGWTFPGHPLSPGGLMEVGVLGPLADGRNATWFLSADYSGTVFRQQKRLLPSFSVGYSRIFGIGNAINYGVSVDFYYRKGRAVRFETKDYYTFSTVAHSPQHNVAFRVGWLFSAHDT